MAKKFPVPRKIFNPRAVHLYDLVALVVVFAVALTVLPIGTTLDLSAGFNEKSDVYQDYESEEINQVFGKPVVSPRTLNDLFSTTTIQNGGTVYRRDANVYWLYQNGKEGMTYYSTEFGDSKEPKALTSASGDLPRGLISDDWYISVGEDGRIYYDDLNGLSGWSDYYVDRTKANPEDMTRTLVSGHILTVEEAALVWVMAQERTLIGFADKTAWFAVPGESGVRILKGTVNGVEEVVVIDGVVEHTMVAENKLLFYVQDGNVTIYNLETGETLYYPNTTDWQHLGQVRQLAYVKLSNGSIRLYSLNSVTSTYANFTGVGTESGGATTMSGIDSQNYTEIFTTRGNDLFTVWFQDIGQIVWMHKED